MQGRLEFRRPIRMDAMRNDERDEPRSHKMWEDRAPAATMRWLTILGLLFLTAAVFGGVYAYQQSITTSDLTAQNQALHSTINQMRNQIGLLTAKLEKMNTPPPAQVPAAGAPAAKHTTSTSTSSAA